MIAGLFLSFLGISISVSFIIALLLLLTPFLNKQYAAKWKYWIWIVLAFRLIIPLGGDVGRYTSLGEQKNPVQASLDSENRPVDTTAGAAARGRVIVEFPAQMTAPIMMQPEKNGGNISILDIVAFIWMLGSLLIISVHLLSYFRCRRDILKKGRIVKDSDSLRLLRELRRELHIKRTVPVIEYADAASPMVIGFFKPALVLPKEHYEPEELFFILKHECIHLKRGDVFFKLLFITANAIHWINPLIWIMQKEASVDMELSCDERVTQGADYAARKAYTETLLSTLHKQSTKKTVLSTQFYGGKQIMKKRFKNILVNTVKKNGAAIWIGAVILTVSLGTLVGCSAAKEDAENKKDMQAEVISDESTAADEPLTEPDTGYSKEEYFISDYAVSMENLTIALYEGKQDIASKLNEAGVEYNEYDSELKYQDTDYNKYDSYYMIGESPLGTDASLWVDASLCAYFKDDICVRLEFLNESPLTARGIHAGDSYSRLIGQYGDSFEKHTYAAQGVYNVYRYSFDDYICEFGILEDHPDSIYDIDLYAPELYPVYDYGEEIVG